MKRIPRTRRSVKRTDPRLLISLIVMAIGYLIGCCLGARFGSNSHVPRAVVTILTEHSSSSGEGFLSVFGEYGFYGVLFLILSTTYLGFLFVPAIFTLKGFVTGALFFAYLQSGVQNAFLLAGIALCLPGIFVLPALLLLGNMSITLSFQLLCRMRGAPAGNPSEKYDRILAISFVLLLISALVETYVLPALSVTVAS